MAVSATEISNGKNRAKTGNKIVPKPNPEKKVSAEPSNAAEQMTKISKLWCFKNMKIVS